MIYFDASGERRVGILRIDCKCDQDWVCLDRGCASFVEMHGAPQILYLTRRGESASVDDTGNAVRGCNLEQLNHM